MTLLEQIASLELVKIRFRLEFLEPFHFEPEMILHWRRELVRGARLVLESDMDRATAFAELLDPLPAVDPVARKRFQKPAPLFIIDPKHLCSGDYTSGDMLNLDVLFPGDGVRHTYTFTEILGGLGQLGLHKGRGRFALKMMSALTHNDGWQSVWQHEEALDHTPLPFLNARWLIESTAYTGHPLELRFVTPARLLKKNRPVFVAEFSDIFPFIIRRVTSVLYSSSRLELPLEIPGLLADAVAVATRMNRLVWVDWRQLDAKHGLQGIGGLSGRVQLTDGVTDDLYTVLGLAEMFNIGKWASYGAGCFVLDPV